MNTPNQQMNMESKVRCSSHLMEESDIENYICQEEKEEVLVSKESDDQSSTLMKHDSIIDEDHDTETPPQLDLHHNVVSSSTVLVSLTPPPLTGLQRQDNYRNRTPGAYSVRGGGAGVSFSDDDDDINNISRNVYNNQNNIDTNESAVETTTTTQQQNNDIMTYPFPIVAELVIEDVERATVSASNTNQAPDVVPSNNTSNSNMILVKAEPVYPDDKLKNDDNLIHDKPCFLRFQRSILILLYIAALTLTVTITVTLVLRQKHNKQQQQQFNPSFRDGDRGDGDQKFSKDQFYPIQNSQNQTIGDDMFKRPRDDCLPPLDCSPPPPFDGPPPDNDRFNGGGGGDKGSHRLLSLLYTNQN